MLDKGKIDIERRMQVCAKSLNSPLKGTIYLTLGYLMACKLYFVISRHGERKRMRPGSKQQLAYHGCEF